MLHAKVRRNSELTSSNMCMLRELTIRLRCDLKMVDNEGIQVKFLTTLFLSHSLTHSLSTPFSPLLKTKMKITLMMSILCSC